MSKPDLTLHQEVHALYIDHYGWLQSWIRRKLGNAFDANDMAQDVFMRLLLRKQPVQVHQPRAFLSTIAHGFVVEHWRRRELELAWQETLASWPAPEVPPPESRLIFLETLIEIDRMLDALKPAVRSAFLMAQLDGLTCPQIAERIGVSLATVERYIAKALRRCYTLRFEP